MYKTQEFAKLCGTTKETLFHYDKLGLLKPNQVLKNGYRVYSYKKLLHFQLLSFLKDSGGSLKEIEAIYKAGTTKKNGCALMNVSEQIEKQLSKLEKESIFLKGLGELAVEVVEGAPNSLEIQKAPKQSFLLLKTDPKELITEEDYSEVLQKTLEAPMDVPPFGVLLDSEAAKDGKIVILGILFLKDSVDISTKIKIKKGQFAVWYGKGDFAAKKSAVSTVIQEIIRTGFDVDGNILCFNVLDLLRAEAEEAYFKLMIPVS